MIRDGAPKFCLYVGSAILMVSCSSFSGAKDTSISQLARADSLLGTWQWVEVTSGVEFSTTFMPQGQLIQHFRSLNDGYSKNRIGTWQLFGVDTLVIRDAQGADSLCIVKLSEGSLELMRSDSIPLFFECK